MSAGKEEEQEGGEKKSSKKMLIIIIVLVLLLGGGGFFGYTKFLKKKADPEGEGHGGHEAKPAKIEQPIIQDIDTFLVNLADPGGKRYLKVTMKARMSGPSTQADFEAHKNEIRDMILTLLSNKEYEDIGGAEGKLALKREIIAQFNKVIKQGQVQDVYFSEFLVQ